MRNLYKTIYLALLILSVTIVQAQQESQFAHNMFNNLAINPGFAGSAPGICATGIARQQWVGFKDEAGNSVAPQTYALNIHSPLDILHGGVGLSVYQDQLGYQKEIGVKLIYAYRKDIGLGNLGVGVQVGFINGNIDFATLSDPKNVRDAGDPLLDGKGKESDMLLDFAVGVHYMVPEKFYVGLSATRLTESKSSSELLAYKTKRHYFFTAGYDISFPNNPSFVIEPSLLVKSDAVKTQYDLAALVKYNNKVWGGVSFSSFRVMDPLSVLVGVKIKEVRLGYAYTIPTSAIGSGGSHEVMVGYCFKINFEKGRRSYQNTRFL